MNVIEFAKNKNELRHMINNLYENETRIAEENWLLDQSQNQLK